MLPSPTSEYVQKFAELMEQRLSENRQKGDRPGWLAQDEGTLLRAAEANLKAVDGVLAGGGSVDDMRKHAADTANFLMMLADLYSQPGR